MWLYQSNRITTSLGENYWSTSDTRFDARSFIFGLANVVNATAQRVSKGACGGNAAVLFADNSGGAGVTGSRSMISAFDNGGGDSAAVLSGNAIASNASKFGGGGGGAAGKNGTVTSGNGFAGCVRVIITRGLINDPFLMLHDTDTFLPRLFY
jgi:hypothetical protein